MASLAKWSSYQGTVSNINTKHNNFYANNTIVVCFKLWPVSLIHPQNEIWIASYMHVHVPNIASNQTYLKILNKLFLKPQYNILHIS